MQERASIKVSLDFFGKKYKTIISLTDRTDMKYPMLIGRKFLVDVLKENMAEKKGWEVRVIDYLKCSIEIMKGKLNINYLGSELPVPDAIIPRIGASRTFYGTAMIRHFEMMDVFSTSGSLAVSRSRDKLRSLQILSKQQVYNHEKLEITCSDRLFKR